MPKRTKLSPRQEAKFQKYYRLQSRRLKLNPDPDAPGHKYDYRGAFKAEMPPDLSGHWPSRFKDPSHPRRVIKGVDTATGKRVKRPRR